MTRFTLPLFTVLASRIALAIACNTVSLLLNDVCQEIACSTSAESEVYDILSLNYALDISHWAASSTQSAMCSFEPGTAEDLGIALEILGKSKTPFAVKGGGHTCNQGFSSTPGVQISMTRFSEVSYDPTTETATVGAGLIWDDVYAALEEHGVIVVGGRVSGIGVAGFTLGGGYSWLSNQHGLTADTVQGFELILPNGTLAKVTETKNPDLFFALKGGLNNFGIVTKFTLKTFQQGDVWGGPIFYTASVMDQVKQATANFAAHNTDPKAALITTYNCLLGIPGADVEFFYDGSEPADGVFDEFLAIPWIVKDVSTRSFTSLVKSFDPNVTAGTRGVFNAISSPGLPLSLLDSVVDETMQWCEKLLLEPGLFISYDVEPFLPTYLSHNTTPTAFPPSRAEPVYPVNIYYAWLLPTSDQDFWDAARTSASRLQAEADKLAQTDSTPALYPNYAIFDTPLANMYGDNLPRLEKIKGEVDPSNVMGLAGGFKINPPQ